MVADDRVERTVEVPVPPEELWAAVADPAALADWFDAEVELEMRPGGSGRFVLADGGARRVLVHEVEPGRHLSFSWWPDNDGRWRLTERTTVTMTLEPAPAGTRLRVVESRSRAVRARAAA
jgi:uncharacterized protein YndB with AHSA1/START domain